MSGDVAGYVGGLVAPMRAHLAKLDGDLDAASHAADDLRSAAGQLTAVGQDHDTQVHNTLASWYGPKADTFQGRGATFASAVSTLSGNLSAIEDAANSAVTATKSGRTNIQKLIDEFISWATPRLQAAAAASAAGNQQAVLTACADAKSTADQFTVHSASELQKVSDTLTALVATLRGLPQVNGSALNSLGDPIGGGDDNGLTGVSGTDVPVVHGGGGGGGGPALPPTPAGGPTLGTGGITSSVTGTAAPAAGGSFAAAGGGASGGGGSSDFGGGGGGFGGGGGGSTPVGPKLPQAIPVEPGTGVQVNLPGGGTAQAPNEQAATAVRAALSALGTPYVWGASNPREGTDCSGLTSWSYAHAGVTLPRHSAAQALGASVPAGQTAPGDLVVWNGHVAMVIGPGEMVEAGEPVKVSPIRTTNCGDAFLGFYRPTGGADAAQPAAQGT